MTLWQAVILGFVQGITEFLPISSSGHLVVLEHLWKLPKEARLPLTAMLHGATLLAVISYFAPQLGRLVAGLGARDSIKRSTSWRMVGFIIFASVPAAGVGLLLDEVIERVFTSPLLVGLMLLVTGGMLLGTRRIPAQPGHRGQPLGGTGWVRALLVGVAQAIAILPGISRSGATISSGLYLGMERQQAFEFSFLLAIPAITGAFFLEIRKVRLAVLSPLIIGVSMTAAFASGLAALVVLGRAVAGRKLYLFGFYCWLAGLLVLIFLR